jgi:hypothetical protein
MNTQHTKTLAVLGIITAIGVMPMDGMQEWPHVMQEELHIAQNLRNGEPAAIAEHQSDNDQNEQAAETPVAQQSAPEPVSKSRVYVASNTTPAPEPAIVTHYSMRNRQVAREIAQN